MYIQPHNLITFTAFTTFLHQNPLFFLLLFLLLLCGSGLPTVIPSGIPGRVDRPIGRTADVVESGISIHAVDCYDDFFKRVVNQ